MPQFDYVVKDASGQTANGTITATTEQDAARALRARGYTVTALTQRSGITSAPVPAAPQVAPVQWWRVSLFPRIRLRDLAIFFREVSTMLSAGVPLSRSLDVQANATPNPTLKHILRQASTRVQAGENLAPLLENFPHVFSRLIVGLIRTGETTGGLDQMCRSVADYLEREWNLREQIKRQTFYPKLLVLSILFIPTLPTLFLGGFGAWCTELFRFALMVAPFVLVGGVFWYAMKQYRETHLGRVKMDELKLGLPVFGKVITRLALAKFCRALSTLYTAGIHFVQGLPLAADACGNEAIAESIRQSVPDVEQGEKLSAVLQRSRHFDPTVLQVVATGEETGNMDTMLDKVAEFFEQEAETSIHQMTVSLGPLLIILCGLIVGIKVVGFYAGFYGSLP